MTANPGRRWLRRNWWGLAMVAPLLATAVVLSPDDSYQVLRDSNTEEVVRPGADGWASYGGGRFRLTGFGRAELVDSEGQPYPVPGGLVAWRVTVMVDTGGDPDALIGCSFELADVAGRRYGESPQALGYAYRPDGVGVPRASCSPPYEVEDETAPFETAGHYLLPESTEPAALRISMSLHEPAYVRFDVG